LASARPSTVREFHGAENWKRRLGELILESDAIVFVLTPASVHSPICEWEVQEALRLNKRIVPVLAQPLNDAQVHESLRALQYIYFYEEGTVPGSGFGSGIAFLAAALAVNIEWIREHTRIGELASHWRDEEHSTDLLLRGSELVRSQQWRDSKPANAPELTALQREFLQASEEAESARYDAERREIEEKKRALEQVEAAQTERRIVLQKLDRRTRFGVLGMSVMAVVLGFVAWLAYWASVQAKVQKQQAQLQKNDAQLQKHQAQQALARLEGAALRLREGMKLRIADTDHVVTTTEKWYRIATDYKLSIGTYRAPMFDLAASDIGTGFLVQGGGLRPEWKGRVVFITASHVIHAGDTRGQVNLSQASIVFPGIGENARVRPNEVLFESAIDALDVAVLGLASAPPRFAVAVDLPSQIQSKETLDGIAVLHWTGADGFTLGFGHGVSTPPVAEVSGDRMYYTHVTGPGASGAPVFDANSGSVVCLHVGGLPPTERRRLGFCTSMAKIVAAIARKS